MYWFHVVRRCKNNNEDRRCLYSIFKINYILMHVPLIVIRYIYYIITKFISIRTRFSNYYTSHLQWLIIKVRMVRSTQIYMKYCRFSCRLTKNWPPINQVRWQKIKNGGHTPTCTQNQYFECSPSIIYKLLYEISTFLFVVVGMTDSHVTFKWLRTMHWSWHMVATQYSLISRTRPVSLNFLRGFWFD